MKEKISHIIRESIEAKTRFLENCVDDLQKMARLMTETLRGGGQIFLFGNGGSASDAQHIEGELMGRLLMERPALPVRALTANPTLLTALGNDYSFEEIFSRQLAIAKAGDVALGISTSGNSPNILKGLQAARGRGAKTIGMTGESGGKMPAFCDVILKVPSKNTQRIQECHILAGHIVCELIEESLFGPS